MNDRHDELVRRARRMPRVSRPRIRWLP